MFPGLGPILSGAERSPQLCACVFLEESLAVRSCEFINPTAFNRADTVCILPLRSGYVQSPLQGPVKLTLRSRSSMRTPP